MGRRESQWRGDPVVIDPPGFDQAEAWQECRDYVDKCGGLIHDDGEPNWRAAFGADPGVCSCPVCRAMYWAWGRRQRCVDCGYEYPTDAWLMYSYGASEAMRQAKCLGFFASPSDLHERRMAHPFYRHGFEHPPENAMEEFDRIDWRSVVPNVTTP